MGSDTAPSKEAKAGNPQKDVYISASRLPSKPRLQPFTRKVDQESEPHYFGVAVAWYPKEKEGGGLSLWFPF